MNLSNLIPPQYRAYAVCALVAILLALGFAGGWAVNGWREGAETERLRTAHAQEAAARVQRVPGRPQGHAGRPRRPGEAVGRDRHRFPRQLPEVRT
jgi:hypothetical protein